MIYGAESLFRSEVFRVYAKLQEVDVPSYVDQIGANCFLEDFPLILTVRHLLICEVVNAIPLIVADWDIFFFRSQRLDFD